MQAGALAAVLAAPAIANPARERAYLEARVAADSGADARASRQFAELLAADPDSKVIAERALEHALTSGDYPLALTAARRLDAAGTLPPLRRILLAAEALRTRDWAAAEREAARLSGDQVLSLMSPAIRAWRAFGAREADPAAALAPMENGPVSGYAVEHRALLELAAGRGDGSLFLALSPDAGLRPQHLRLLAAAEFQARGDRAKALALASGEQPAMAAARRMIEAGRPLPGRLDTAAEGFAEFLARVAIDFSQQNVGREGLILARLASYLAPEAAQPLMIAAEIADDNNPAGAARILARVPAASPLASTARDLRIALMSRGGESAAAFAEVSERTRGGSREVRDWVQLGQLHDDANRYDEAAQAYARAQELARTSPDPALPLWSIVLARAGALDQGGKWPEARAALREAHRLAPTEPLVLNYLGYAMIDRGEAMDESEAMIREAVRLAPDNAAIVDSLGWALFKRGRVDEAVPLLERAARAEPGDIEINEHLGDAYYSAGRRIEARFAWNAALVYAEGAVAERLRGKIDRGLPFSAAR